MKRRWRNTTNISSMNEWKTVERGIRYRPGKDGKKVYYIDLRHGGGRIRHKVNGALAEAREARAAILLDESKREPGEPRKPRRVRLSVFIVRYVEDYLEVNAPGSLRHERNRIDNIKRKLGDKYLDAVTAGDIERLLAGLVRKGRTAGTHNRYRSRLLSIFNKAVDWGYIEDNPVQRVKRLREHRKGDRYLSNGELGDLLNKCDPQLRPLVHLAALTGIRQGALLKMDWSDFEPDLAFVTLRGEITKSGEPRRVPLVPEARKVLEGMGQKFRGPLFQFKHFPRKRWDAVIHNLEWDEIDNPRLRGWNFHDLRHHAASQMVMGGMSLPQVGKVLGHEQLQTTMRYAHFADDRLAEDMERAFEKFSHGQKRGQKSESPEE